MIHLRRLVAIAVAALAAVPADAEIVHRLGALRTLEDAAAGDLALEESALGSFSTSMSLAAAEEFLMVGAKSSKAGGGAAKTGKADGSSKSGKATTTTTTSTTTTTTSTTTTQVPGYYECPVDLEFTALASDGVKLAVSGCIDCTEEVTLPFSGPFNFLNAVTTTAVRVSSNGQINIDPRQTSSNCCLPDPIADGGYTAPRIALFQEDLYPGASPGGIYTKVNADGSFTISFEEILYLGNDGEVNVQATLFEDGRVFLCFGDALGIESNDDSASGLEDDASLQWYPNPLDGFNAVGIFPASLVWPEPDCACFFPGTGFPTPDPVTERPASIQAVASEEAKKEEEEKKEDV